MLKHSDSRNVHIKENSRGKSPHNDTVFITDKNQLKLFVKMFHAIADCKGGVEKAKDFIPISESVYYNLKHGVRLSTDLGRRILSVYKNLKTRGLL